MVTQPAQDQAFPLKALITLKPEGSVSRRKTNNTNPGQGTLWKKKVEEVQLYKGGTNNAK